MHDYNVDVLIKLYKLLQKKLFFSDSMTYLAETLCQNFTIVMKIM